MSKNKSLQIILFLFVLLFVFFSAGAEFLHNHHDGDFHSDCPICLWLATINAFVFLCIFVCFGFSSENPQPFFYDNTPPFISKPFHVIQYLRSPPSPNLPL